MPAGYTAFSGRTPVANGDDERNARDCGGAPAPGEVGGSDPFQKQPSYFQFQAWPVGFKLAAASALGVGALAFSTVLELPIYGFTVLLLYPAVLVSAYFWGRAAGFACTLVTAISFATLLHVDEDLPSATATASIAAILLFVFAGLSASVMLSTLRRALRATNREHAEAVILELEKDLLLRELRHRFKNDLANVCAILRIDASSLNGDAADTILRAVNRVQVIAQLHERLEPERHASTVEAGSFIQALCANFQETFLSGRDIQLEVACRNIFLSAKRAVDLGLIANELITNALKHAFPDGRSGTINVTLTSTVTDGELVIRDDGIGIPDAQNSGSGRRLIDALVRHMGANLQRRPSDKGTCWRLRFGFN